MPYCWISAAAYPARCIDERTSAIGTFWSNLTWTSVPPLNSTESLYPCLAIIETSPIMMIVHDMMMAL